jgi:RNA polymerase sigma factor (sigma-70 family)
LLRDPNDVDDAFQATFLVLVRRAGTLRRRDLLGNWLYGVAHRVALRSRALSARRLARAPHGPDVVDRLSAAGGRQDGSECYDSEPEPIPWLHEEVRHLPEKYRVPVVLCYLEGLTHDQAASRLGWPIGTVKGRLARARDLLRKRLTRRGLTLSTAALDAHLALPEARSAVPESLQYATIRAARAIAGAAGASILAASSVSLPVAVLADGVLRAMITTQVKAISLILLVAGALTTGFVLAAAQGPDPQTERSSEPPAAVAKSDSSGPSESKSQSSAPQKKGATTKKAAGSAGGQPQPGAGGMMMGMGGGMGGMRGMGGGMGIGGFGGDGAPDGDFQTRLEIAGLSAALAANDNDPKNQAVLKKLDQTLTMSFANPTPLGHVLEHIKSALAEPNGKPIPIYVDPIGLQQAEATFKSPVTIDLEGVPLKMSLRLVLKQLGLAYCVRDGVLIISSVRGIREELAEAASELRGKDPEQRAWIMQSVGGTGGGMMMGGGMR